MPVALLAGLGPLEVSVLDSGTPLFFVRGFLSGAACSSLVALAPQAPPPAWNDAITRALALVGGRRRAVMPPSMVRLCAAPAWPDVDDARAWIVLFLNDCTDGSSLCVNRVRVAPQTGFALVCPSPTRCRLETAVWRSHGSTTGNSYYWAAVIAVT